MKRKDLTNLIKPYRIAKNIPNGEEWFNVLKITENCTLEKLYVKFYGHAMNLRAYIEYSKSGSNNVWNSVVGYLGQEYLAGDFEEFEEDIMLPLEKGDMIRVKGVNLLPVVEGQEGYLTLNCRLNIDYFKGVDRG